MASIPEEFHDLFEKETFAHVAALPPDGTPHVTPVWVDYDDETGHVLINTVRGRAKERFFSEDPRVGLSMTDPDDPYRFLSVRGEVAEMYEDGAEEHIDELARRYLDVDEYPNEDENARVIVAIDPEHVATS
ncbi:PPOX class F420-dependent oxidoreductase [Halomicrobium salinisoli]|uniref:PPOX class F420-dependent oxidoreductase n=1 Tax=Halomicrobium salinisoli TaxID=2878391 RepID=UPI001CEFEDA5|nr:PPOX class F420-dependent oxidoreductase [Halomicrobium salinisoli]